MNGRWSRKKSETKGTLLMMINIREKYFRLKKIKWLKLFIFAQLLDLGSTLLGIYFLNFREMNPLMNQFSLLEMSFIKIFGILLMSMLLYYVKNIPIWVYKLLFWLSIIFPFFNILQIIIELFI